MASLNGIFIFVNDEQLKRETEVSSHAVESGIEVTDNVKRQARVLSISGEIVGPDSAKNQAAITNFMDTGTLISYSGRNAMKNAQITSFSTSHPNTIWGGCSFSMELKEVRIAGNSYTPETTEESKEKSTTSENQQGGTQQIQKTATGSLKPVYHTVKAGDTVYNLVAATNAPYKSYGSTVKMTLDNNPDCFSVKGDATTLKVGSKLLVGYEYNENTVNTENGKKAESKEETESSDWKDINISQYGIEANWTYTNGVYSNGKYYGEDVTDRV